MGDLEFLEKIKPDDFEWLQGWLRKHSAIQLEPSRKFLAEKRLRPLLAPRGLPDLRTLFGLLRPGTDAGLEEEVLEALTKSETWFFRDMPVFEALRDSLLPGLQAGAPDRRIRIWSAGCSTGQEPYSLAMHLESRWGADWHRRFEITATDLSARQVAHARDGAYDRESVNRGLPAAFLTRYFTQLGTRWHISEDLRAAVEFRPLRLDQPWTPMAPFDAILLRNVLPYFDEATRLDLLWRVRKQLAPGGILILGASETNELEGVFECADDGRCRVYRQAGAEKAPAFGRLFPGFIAA
jgi:chemotaxis protein methyltransferase CheR